jgi:very-short-patch-repair endonuclease
MTNTSNNYYNQKLQPFARELRQNMTQAEACLWKYALRASSLGVPFRRQRPIGHFIADFVCLPLKLVVEVDGATHHLDETKIKDRQKDEELTAMGFEILRIPDEAVLNNINFVVGVISDKIAEIKKRN